MCLTSGSYSRRVGLWPMSIGLGLGWFFSLIWLMVSVWTFAYNPYWSILIAASTVAFLVLLSLMTYRLIIEAHCRYVFELTSDEAVLNTYDQLRHRHSTQMVLLNDVKYAEYYPFSDSACIILHTQYASMEVPLWPLGTQAQDVLDFLDGRGTTIVNVQSDDLIPN